MKTLKRLTALVVIAAFLTLQVHPAAFADDSDIFGANIQPNVLILLDDSGSMDDEITSSPYAPATSYTVVNVCGSSKNSPCVTPVVYKSGSKSTYTKYADTISGVPKASAQTALSTVGYWSGKISGSNVNLFLGNYLNFQLGVCAAGGCQEKKIDIAKRVMKDVVDSALRADALFTSAMVSAYLVYLLLLPLWYTTMLSHGLVLVWHLFTIG